MPLTAESKPELARTIRALRARLLVDLKDEADRVYLLSIRKREDAGLTEALRERRRQLEEGIQERVLEAGGGEAAEERAWADAVKEAAATILNRLVLVRHLEALKLSRPEVLTGGWRSRGYQEFREVAPGLVQEDESEGYAFLLELLFGELAVSLPGLFGEVGLSRLLPVPVSTLRDVVEELDKPELRGVWDDDTTLGWVYQYWNDPEREELDKKLNRREKLEPHEIASKTQMFTERYLVEWLLQNSLGVTWLAMCENHGWKADALEVLPRLEERRAEWRQRREAGEVPLDALLPVEGELEEHWKYYVLQPITQATREGAPESIRELRLLDPACGSGHFLVIAFDLLAAMYREEARHRGETWSDREIAESILANNLHGIDIDPRAVQIAAAALYVKARAFAKDAQPERLNLVAPVLRLAALDRKDPSLVRLRREVREATGLPEELTDTLIDALKGADHLGTLLKVDKAVDEALAAHDRPFVSSRGQLDWVEPERSRVKTVSRESARTTLLEKLEAFLAAHSGAEDLGLRLQGEQLAAGVRFVRLAREGHYHLVVGNPPYQGTTRMRDAKYVARNYPRAKADLYAAFLERSLGLTRAGGASALLTMRSWMFLTQYRALREHLLESEDLRLIGDIDRGAFEEVANEVLAVAVSVFRRISPGVDASVAVQPSPLGDKSYDRQRTARKRAAVLAQVGRFEFSPTRLKGIPEQPLIYWWSQEQIAEYAAAPKLGEIAPARNGLSTQDNARFLRKPWEVPLGSMSITYGPLGPPFGYCDWAPYIKGAEGRAWFEPLSDVVRWRHFGLEPKVFTQGLYGSHSRVIKNESLYFRQGIAFSVIGANFTARWHRWPSVFGHMGASVFPSREDVPDALCLMNSSRAQGILSSLNPGMHFLAGDVNRLPRWRVPGAGLVFETLEREFALLEHQREPSVEFKQPGKQRWSGAQEWAQATIDANDPHAVHELPPQWEEPSVEAQLSFAVGVVLGRFDAQGLGVLSEPDTNTLANGVLFVSAKTGRDSLVSPQARPLHDVWEKLQAGGMAPAPDLRAWLAKPFFEWHSDLYESRPIYLPLSSSKRNFIAFASIHRWARNTLQALLAEHLHPERRALEGELNDLRAQLASTERAARSAADRRFTEVQKLHQELTEFIDLVTEVAERGPPRPDTKTPEREVDAPFEMDLDDGVFVNAAALWALLKPMWKEPEKWWKEIASEKGGYDWAHLTRRYFPTRVDRKCREEPSHAVAHGCFWKYHPAKAYQWELRLQDEIRPDFRIDEPGAEEARALFLDTHADEVRRIEAAERKRREKKAKQQDQDELFEDAQDEASDD